MLVRCHPERSLVHTRDLLHSRFEVLIRLVLYPPVLNETREVVLAVFAGVPAEVVHIAVESERSGRLQLVTQQVLNLSLERLEAHAINGIFQTSVLYSER